MIMCPPRVIVVEDHVQLCEELVTHLKDAGLMAHGVFSGEELDDLLMELSPEVVILDLNLPGEDGLSIAARLRASRPRIGLIFLTGRNRSSDREKGYEQGADMYLSKPASPREVILAIQTLMRRLQEGSGGSRCGWIFETQSRRLISPERKIIGLTPNEAKLLKRLAMAANHSLPTHELLTTLEFSFDHGGKIRLEVMISRLRKKLAPYIGPDPFIKSLRGVGYQCCLALTLE